jgi:hypothetical protein
MKVICPDGDPLAGNTDARGKNSVNDWSGRKTNPMMPTEGGRGFTLRGHNQSTGRNL